MARSAPTLPLVTAVALVAAAACPLAASEVPGAMPLPLLPAAQARALAAEISGEAARRHVETFALHHRMRGSRGFRAAAEHVIATLRANGYPQAEILALAADGIVFYGTQRSRPAWDADFAELWEVREGAFGMNRVERLASWDAAPISLAQDSSDAEVLAELVDVGEGTREADYRGREVRGRIVLAGAQPGPVAALAVARHGALGVVSYAPNQRTGWWLQDASLVRWGHLDTFAAHRTFGFMISLERARALQARLAHGERVLLQATVRAGQHPGSYDLATATIPGRRAEEEIIFSCHLDHPRPGANDNASGCAAILEIARAYAKLIAERRLPAPLRTLRFVWPPEIEGTMALLTGRPEIAGRLRAAIHLDMVGGGPETKATLHVTRGPASLPSFVNDVAEALAAFVNAETDRLAATGVADWPLLASGGGREPLRADSVAFTRGSDHEVYTEASFSIPAIYLNDWPDRYIHTHRDRPDIIDSTRLQRAAFLAAASGWVLANLDQDELPALLAVLRAQALRRAAALLERRAALSPDEAANLTRHHLAYERALLGSLARFAPPSAEQHEAAAGFLDGLTALLGPLPPAAPPTGPVYTRQGPAGPMTVFGYDYLEARYGAERTAALPLLAYRGAWGAGEAYAYEALNLVDGRRTLSEIRDALAGTFGPVPVEHVGSYLAALEEIGVVRRGR